jgi:hypothetical protein
MKPRWIVEEGAAPPGVVDSSVIARWWPGRFYKVFTIYLGRIEGRSNAIDLRMPGPDGKLPAQSELPEFLTSVFKCDKHGILFDMDQPLFDNEAATKEDALRNHRVAVMLFSISTFAEILPFARAARAKERTVGLVIAGHRERESS